MAAFTEIDRILKQIRSLSGDLEGLALATVVQVEGSSYRRTGARMLIQENGKWHGAISGGCLEGNALRRAREVMRTKVPQLVVYDTRTDESAKEIGASLGCRGVIQVWIEPITEFDALKHLETLAEAFSLPENTYFLRILESSHPDYQPGNFYPATQHPFTGELSSHTPMVGLHRIRWEGASLSIAVEKIEARIRLLLFGGGQDVIPVMQLGKQMGWEVTVTDECAAKALPMRFAAADQVVHLNREAAVAALQPDNRTAAVLISHNFGYDKAILKELVRWPAPYIGILGPRKRFVRLDEELDGILDGHHAIHAPVGLDLGGETPFEIALAIISEIQAAFSGRSGGKLRDRSGFIHERNSVPA